MMPLAERPRCTNSSTCGRPALFAAATARLSSSGVRTAVPLTCEMTSPRFSFWAASLETSTVGHDDALCARRHADRVGDAGGQRLYHDADRVAGRGSGGTIVLVVAAEPAIVAAGQRRRQFILRGTRCD